MIFSFTKCYPIHILILSYPIVQFLIFYLIPSYITPIKQNAFSTSIVLSSGSFIVGLIGLIYQFIINTIQRIREKKKSLLIKYVNAAFKQVKDKVPKYKKFLIVLSSVVSMSMLTIISVYTRNVIQRNSSAQTNATNLIYSLFFLASFLLFSKLFLKIQLYKHHYISLVIIVFGLIALLIKTVILNDILTLIPYFIIVSIVIGLLRIYLRIVMEKKYILPMTMTCYYGLFGLFFLSIVYLIVYQYQINNEFTVDILNIASAWQQIGLMGWKGITLTCVDILLFGVYTLECCLINYYETPMYDCLLASFVNVFEFIFLAFKEKFISVYFVLSVFGAILLSFGVFVYIEIIIVYLCNMNVNTREEMIKRANIEVPNMSSLNLSYNERGSQLEMTIH